MTRYEVMALVVAFAAFGTAVLGIVFSYNANRRSHATQEKLLELERARERDRVTDRGRADVRARFIQVDKQRYLKVENEGQGTARNVQVTVEGKPINEDPRLRWSGAAPTTLGPGAIAKALATSTLSSNPLYKLRITWQDDSGSPGQWEADLNG